MKKVLTPKGTYVSLEESGLQFLGIKTNEQIEIHNQIQARFNKESEKEKEREKLIDSIENKLKEIVKKNNLQEEYTEMQKRCFSLKEEILATASADISIEDRDILTSFVKNGNI